MKKIKFEVIRDMDGDVRGYKLGNNYLMKHYYSLNNNDYEWIINKDGESCYLSCEISNALDNGEISFARSCKHGKEILIKRFLEEC